MRRNFFIGLLASVLLVSPFGLITQAQASNFIGEITLDNTAEANEILVNEQYFSNPYKRFNGVHATLTFDMPFTFVSTRPLAVKPRATSKKHVTYMNGKKYEGTLYWTGQWYYTTSKYNYLFTYSGYMSQK